MHWTKQYPPGVPSTIDVPQQTTLVSLLDTALKSFAERDLCVCMDSRLTYREVDELSANMSAWLLSLGLERGTRVALMMPNVPQYLVGIVGILRAGMVVVNVNPLYTARELEHQLQDSGAEVILILENFANTLELVVSRTAIRYVVLTALGDLLGFWKGRFINFAVRHVKRMVPEFKLPNSGSGEVLEFNEMLDRGAACASRPAWVLPDDIAFLQYTGGTTGVSKGAVLLHRNVTSNLLQVNAWFRPELERLGPRQLTILCALPLYHIFALTLCAMMGSHLGARILLIPNPRDVRGLVRTLSSYRVHLFPAVNTLFNALLNDQEFGALDFSELLVTMGGGMAVQRSTAQRWLRVTGCPITEGYGLSETSPVATSNPIGARDFSGSIGLPVPSTEILIANGQGEACPPGIAGEIWIRGPQVMAGYWKRPAESASAMTQDGFFKSGDVGIMDADGYIRIVDRQKDMILVSGFNVYPNEIEQVVSLHPSILECAAVGIPDEKSGEAVKLFVVRKDSSLSEDDVARFCRENFTAYKVPKVIEFREELPKSNVGKILRRELRH